MEKIMIKNTRILKDLKIFPSVAMYATYSGPNAVNKQRGREERDTEKEGERERERERGGNIKGKPKNILKLNIH